MWLDILPLLSLLSKHFSNDGNVATSNGDVNKIEANNLKLIKVQNVSELLKTPACNFRETKTELAAFPLACQTLLMTLDLEGLLELAEQMNNTLSLLASDVFNQKYANYTVKIDHNGDRKTDLILMNNETILMLGLNTTRKILKHFGRAIQKLTIQTQRFSVPEQEIILGFVDEYCKLSLNKLSLEITNGDTLKKLTSPFEKVEDFTCNVIDVTEVAIRNHNSLNSIFPNIRNLTLIIQSDRNTDFVGVLPNLENLNLIGDVIELDNNRKNTKYLYTERLFQKNHNITSLKLVFYPPDYLNVVRIYLWNIESLAIWHFDLSTHIYFTSVKKLEFLSPPIGSPKKMSFSNLQEVRLKYNAKHEREWIDFFTNNRHLKRVYIEDDAENEKYFSLESLGSQLMEVEELSILSNNNIPFSEIVKFVEINWFYKLQRFTYGSKNFNENDGEYLKKELENKWNITEFNDHFDGFLFERIKIEELS
ncbi:uncharacterized protein LOC116350321 [Contarinia nasturtii]|uniref:uncharacterized protein LOC116350321 n=1 Tax=Contarinia nasturtii TaxID=265458 RepID=UPI0012D47FAF|nr:uncharacterized protein LOC116350321 [Contarinia nasturtii]